VPNYFVEFNPFLRSPDHVPRYIAITVSPLLMDSSATLLQKRNAEEKKSLLEASIENAAKSFVYTSSSTVIKSIHRRTSPILTRHSQC
jgi:nucleoside-diphosphate-sugar epimerase